jgi:uncharacterized membrane protein YfcA
MRKILIADSEELRKINIKNEENYKPGIILLIFGITMLLAGSGESDSKIFYNTFGVFAVLVAIYSFTQREKKIKFLKDQKFNPVELNLQKKLTFIGLVFFVILTILHKTLNFSDSLYYIITFLICCVSIIVYRIILRK